MAISTHDPAMAAYEAMAPFYDRYTAGYPHERWLEAVDELARAHGLRGHRLLDVACGTGKSFLPMLRRGYRIVACDLSPAMVEVARRKVGASEVEVLAADMRELPDFGEFDLVTCLDDALNYLLTQDELEAALGGIARNMRPGAIAVFDVNTLATYRRFFAADAAADSTGAFFCWRGEAPDAIEPGLTAAACLEMFREREDGLWERSRARHEQRHHGRAAIETAVDAAELELAAVYGQLPGARIEPVLDEERHTKALYLARKPIGEGGCA